MDLLKEAVLCTDEELAKAQIEEVFQNGYKLSTEEFEYIGAKCSDVKKSIGRLFEYGGGLHILNFKNRNEITRRLLIPAIESGWVEMCEVLLQHSVRAFFTDDTRSFLQPLWIACFGNERSRVTGSNSMVRIVKLLVEKTTVWLRDLHGRLLVDCLWIAEKGTTYPSRSYLIPENRNRIRDIILNTMIHWSPMRHNFFPKEFRERVRTFLLCEMRLRSVSNIVLPRDPRSLILKELAVAETFDRPDEMDSFFKKLIKRELRQIVDKDMSERVLQRTLKRELIKDATDMYDEEKRKRARPDIPKKHGTLLCYKNDELVGQCDIVHSKSGCITVGRKAATSGSEGLDFDLHRLTDDTKKVSRVHFSIRFNGKSWQILVHGRNGVYIRDIWHCKTNNWFTFSSDNLNLNMRNICNLSFRIAPTQ